jgi:hypothetical protein
MSHPPEERSLLEGTSLGEMIEKKREKEKLQEE